MSREKAKIFEIFFREENGAAAKIRFLYLCKKLW